MVRQNAPRYAVPRDETISQFLVLCLRGKWDPPRLEDARRLAESCDLNWSILLQVVQREALAPILFSVVRGKNIVPAEVEQDLAKDYFITAARNTLALCELENVLRELTLKSVPVIVLKGAALLETVYRNAGVRPMEDIDLLVQKKSLPAAIGVLSKWSRTQSLRNSESGAFADHDREMTFLKLAAAQTAIDLHWSLLDSPFYPHTLLTNWAWETAVPLPVGETRVLSLGHEALLLHLCAHQLLDRNRKDLLSLYDMASAIYQFRDQIDWHLVLARARMCDLTTPVKQVFARLSGEWKVPVPLRVQLELNALSLSPGEVAFMAWANSIDRAEVRLLRANLVSMHGWRERLRYVLNNVFPSVSFMRYRYGFRGRFSVILMYPYRWLLSLRRALFR